MKLNGTNKVSLKFDIDDSVSHPGSWRIAFAECKSRKPLGEYTVNSNDTVTIPKCTGDLMIEIKNDGYNSATGQIYHIKASVKTNTIVKPTATTISQSKPASARQQFTGEKPTMQPVTMYTEAQIQRVDTKKSQQ